MKLTTEPTLEDLRPEPADDPVVGDFIVTLGGDLLHVEQQVFINLPGMWYICTDADGGDHMVPLSSVVAVTITPTKGD